MFDSRKPGQLYCYQGRSERRGIEVTVPAKAEAKGKTKSMRGRNGDFDAVESDAEREFQKAG